MNLKTLVRSQVLKEVIGNKRFAKMLGADPKHSDARTYIPNDRKEEFGRWVKTRMTNTIPANVANKDVAGYITDNPGHTKMQTNALVGAFLTGKDLFKPEKTETEPSLETEPTATERGEYAAQGDRSFQDIGDEIGYSPQGAKNIYQSAVDQLKRLVGKEDITSGDEFSPEFIRFISKSHDKIVAEAIDIYLDVIEEVIPDNVLSYDDLLFDEETLSQTITSFLSKLVDHKYLASGEEDEITENELSWIAHAIGLVADSITNDSKLIMARRFLRKNYDMARGEGGLEETYGFKSLEGIVAWLWKLKFHTMDMAAGVAKRGRGRPPGSKNKPKQ